MSKITYTDKVTGGTFTAADANEIKTSVNAAYDAIDTKASTSNVTTLLANKVDVVAGSRLISADEVTALTFATVVKVAYTTEIPFTRSLTIITGKTLESNDTFTIAAGAVEGGGAQMCLIGDGTHSPVFSAFNQQLGTYDSVAGISNLITMEYLDGVYHISILNETAV